MIRRLQLICVLCLTLGLVGALCIASNAEGAVTIKSFNALPGSTQAGSHPDFTVHFSLTTRQRESAGGENPCACNDARDVDVHLPAGLIGNPHATPQCTVADFAADHCPVDSQVGIVEIFVDSNVETSSLFLAPLFNLVPPPEEAGLLGFKSGALDSPSFEVISARTGGDYGLDVDVTNILHAFPLSQVKQVTWGIPAAPIHDDLRFGRDQPAILAPGLIGDHPDELCDAGGVRSTDDPATVIQTCFTGPGQTPASIGAWEGGPGGPVASNSPETPFLQAPTTCGVPLETTLDVLSYDEGESHTSSPWPATTDCASLTFNPSLFARPTATSTDSPSGIDIDLKAPEFESPDTPSPSEIRGTTVTLPPGFTINTNAADGKSACADAEARFGTEEEARCPEFAKVGTVEVHSPVLPGVLPGAVYIGAPLPGNRYRLFITFDGFGVHVKFPGTAHLDPQTGQVVTEFKNLPQFPFEDFDLHFFGSERGILATPTQCGTYPVSTEFEPWDGALPNQTSTQFFTLGSGPGGMPCPDGPRPFAPGFGAASAGNTAGAHTSFSLNLTRPDGDQNLSGLTVTTPPGFAATLKGVPYCPEGDIAAASTPGYSGLSEQSAPSCPAASQVGTASAGAGAGTHPFYAPGQVYLAGPYKGAPLSLVVITPAVSGPYDLGNVVVRAALQVNPETAQVTTVSDPLPQILEGIPLRLRSIQVNLDRPNFTVNPTNCEPFATTASALGSEGAIAHLSAPFQVANCAILPFAPKLAISLKGQTNRTGHPALKATVTYPQGGAYANIAKAQVSLPHSEFLDQGNIGKACTRVLLAQRACPAKSVYGSATAWTPLLEKPLTGPVYLVGGFGYKLPAMVAELEGQIRVLLVGKVDTGKSKGIRNTFEAVPDAPVEKFVLQLKGGRKYGLLENSEDICKKPQRAEATFIGQNGKTDSQNPLITNSCGAKAKKKKKRAASRNRRAHR